jgi:hypothetical protein
MGYIEVLKNVETGENDPGENKQHSQCLAEHTGLFTPKRELVNRPLSATRIRGKIAGCGEPPGLFGIPATALYSKESGHAYESSD